MDQSGYEADAFGMLVWTLPVRLVDLSRGGCLVEVARHLETGTNGQLQLEVDGVLHLDDVRVCRCQMREGASRVHHAGVELLRTRRLSRRSLRLLLRRIICNRGEKRALAFEEAAGRDGLDDRELRPEGRYTGRAPPLPVAIDS
jgi:hypothetical protein